MTELEKLEQRARNLSRSDFEKFRDWFMEFDWKNWNDKIERDIESGKLDQILCEAKAEFTAGKARDL